MRLFSTAMDLVLGLYADAGSAPTDPALSQVDPVPPPFDPSPSPPAGPVGAP